MSYHIDKYWLVITVYQRYEAWFGCHAVGDSDALWMVAAQNRTLRWALHKITGLPEKRHDTRGS